MTLNVKRAARLGVALAVGGAMLTGGVAQAQSYPYYYGPASPAKLGVGPADPCARQAAQRRLGWGIVGLLAGGLAGGAAAGAGVVAEGAFLGGAVGSVIGGVAGYRSAACGTAALAAASGAYGPYPQQAYQGGYPGYQGYSAGYEGYGHPTYANPGPQPVTYYQVRRTYRTYTTEQAQPAYDYGYQGGYAQPQPYAQAPQQYAPDYDQQYGPEPQYDPQYGPQPQYAPQQPQYAPQYDPRGRY